MKLTTYLMFFVGILQSCSKDTAPNTNQKNDGNIEITVSGVEDEPSFAVNESAIESQIARAAIIRPLGYKDEKAEKAYDIQILSEFDLLSDVQNPQVSSSTVHHITTGHKGKAASNTKAIKESSKAVTRMVAQTQYRIVFYEQGSTTVAANRVATAGTAMQLTLDAGKTYSWYAVSINSTSVPNINGSGVIPRANLANRDVLYASGVITLAAGNNNLPITFSRKTARIEVDLNVRGLFGRIRNTTSLELGWRSGSTFYSVIEMGDLNIRTGNYSNTASSAASAVTGANMTVTSTTTGDAVKKAIFYTTRNLNIANNVLTLRLNRLDITLDDGNTRSFSQNTLVPISGAMTPSYGSRYIINARLIESALVVGTSRFARTNLIYNDQAGQVDRYRFRPHNNYARPMYNYEYWRWNSATPTGAAGTTNPCSLVYPLGVWTVPHINSYRALGDGPTQSFPIGGVERIVKTWTQTGNTPSNPAYSANSMVLIYLGYYTTGGVLTQASENLGNPGTAMADYWLINSASSTTGDAARFRVVNDNNGVATHYPVVHRTDFLRSSRRPYRCVRS